MDFETTPACELAGLVARPPEGWFNVPFASAPRGHLGCQMMRTGEEKELIGILRIRSVTAPARAFRAESDKALIADERKVMKSMNIEVDAKPVWTRENVPLKGEGFREARGEGYTPRSPATGSCRKSTS